jgi:nucleoside-diphosphate-sugar epimerase
MFSDSSWYREDIENIATFDIDWQKLKDSSILITGATGLIGTVLIDALMYKNKKNKLDIRVYAFSRSEEKLRSRFSSYIDSDKFTIIQGDITDAISIDDKIDFIINLASNTHPGLYSSEPIATIDTIILGTKNILEFAARRDVKRIINTSSVEVYGENRGDVERFTEDYCGYIDCNTLRAGYSEGKRLSEALCQAYVSEKGLDVVSVRLGRVYGASLLKSDTKSTTQFIRNAVNGADIVLKSEGKQEYSYLYVADAITAFLLLLSEGDSGAAYNVAGDEVKSLRETAEFLADINGKSVSFELPDTTESKGYSVVSRALMDSSKIKSLGWRAQYSLDDGLNRTVSILRHGN